MSDTLNTAANIDVRTTGAAEGEALRAAENIGLEHRAPLVVGAVHRLESGREWARLQTTRAQDHVRAHPLRSTAYAVGAGVVAGMLMRAVRPRAR